MNDRAVAASRLADAHAELERDVRAEAGSQADELQVLQEVEMRYLRQGHELRVAVPDDGTPGALEERFHEIHRERYGYAMTDEPMLIVNALLTMTLPSKMRSVRAPGSADVSATTSRSVAFDGARHDAPIIDRPTISHGEHLQGPLIVEQLDTTVVVPPGCTLVRDEVDNLVVTL
jgi:N-methylhydantoinase A